MRNGKKISVEWTTSDRSLTAADVDRLEDLLAVLIARFIVAARSAAAPPAGNREDDQDTK